MGSVTQNTLIQNSYLGKISANVQLKSRKWKVYAISFNLELTRIPKGQSIKLDSSTILQRIIFCTRDLTSTSDKTSQKQQEQEIDVLLSKTEKWVDTCIKSLPNLKTLFQLEINQFKAGNIKNKLPNFQKITKNNELLEKIKGVKILLSRIPRKVYSHNPPKLSKIKAIDAKILRFLKKE